MAPPAGGFAERLESDRLYLRQYRAKDARWYLEMAKRNHGHLARYESGNAAFEIADEAAAREVLRSFAELWQQQAAFFLGVFLKNSDRFVAQIYVGASDEALSRFTLGFFADRAHEGRGYVTEAVRTVLRHLFVDLRAQRVELWCNETNQRCRRVAERCGFSQAAYLSEDRCHADGSPSGSCGYAIFGDQYAGDGRPGR